MRARILARRLVADRLAGDRIILDRSPLRSLRPETSTFEITILVENRIVEFSFQRGGETEKTRANGSVS